MKNSHRGVHTSNLECFWVVSLDLYLSPRNYRITHFCTSPEVCASVWADGAVPVKMWPSESVQWQDSILAASSSQRSWGSASLFPADRAPVPRKGERLELTTRLDPTARAQQRQREVMPPPRPGTRRAATHPLRGQTNCTPHGHREHCAH